MVDVGLGADGHTDTLKAAVELSLVLIDAGSLQAGWYAGRKVHPGKYIRLAPVQVEGAALPAINLVI